jgi:molecular chaperone HscB
MAEKLIKLLHMNCFEVFGLTPTFNVDKISLTKKYQELQKQYHPDNFVGVGSEQQLLAVSMSAYINHAYNTLRSPLLLTLELLKLNNIELNLSENTSLAPEFLIMQMEIHELIEEASQNKAIDALDRIETDLVKKQHDIIKQIDIKFNQNEFIKIIELTKELAFYDKLIKIIASKIDGLL